ncbi:MAG: hypothetical protein GXO26_00460 [Crenarchaeota archaeon]|nr:hypothetical protein [Thermoproteota archaeon]
MFIDTGKAYMLRRHSCFLARLLNIIDKMSRNLGRDPYTREVLTKIRAWGHGHKMLKLAHALGLIERYEDILVRGKSKIRVVFNKITKLGYMLLQIYKLLNKEDEETENNNDDDD